MKRPFSIFKVLAGLIGALALALPAGGATYADDVKVWPDRGGITIDVFLPTSGAPVRANVVVFHGGGFSSSNPNGTMFEWGQDLADKGYAVFNGQYRASFSPEGMTVGPGDFPATWQDAACQVAWVANHAAEYGGVDSGRLYVGGWSAGGHVGPYVAMNGAAYNVCGEPWVEPVGAFGISAPWNVFTPGRGGLEYEEPIGTLIGPSSTHRDHWNDIAFTGANLTNVSLEWLIIHGGLDVVTRPFDARTWHNLLVTNGVSSQLVAWPQAGHSDLVTPCDPQPACLGREDTVDAVHRWIRSVESRHVTSPDRTVGAVLSAVGGSSVRLPARSGN